MSQGVKVSVINAVSKCIDVSELSVRVRSSEAQCEDACEKGSAQMP